MNPIEQRERLLKQFIATAGSWQASGENDKALEQKCDDLLTQIHPERRKALDIVYRHLEWEVAV